MDAILRGMSLSLAKDEKYWQKVTSQISATNNDRELFTAIVNTPFDDKKRIVPLGLGIVVLLLNNIKDGMLDRIALSQTEQAAGAVAYSAKPFKEIRIPIDNQENVINKVITTEKWQLTDDWKDMFIPALTPEEARFNQAGAGIGCSVIYPLASRDGGAIIFSFYLLANDIGRAHHDFMSRYVSIADKALAAED